MSIKLNLKKHRVAIGVCLGIVCIIACAFLNSTPYGIVFAVCAVACCLLKVTCNSKCAHALNIIWCVLSAELAVILSQLLLNIGVGTIELRKLLLGIAVAGFVVSLIFLFTMNYRVAVIATMVLSLGLATVNHFVFWFRGSEFAPYDILAAATAFNVAGNYTFEITAPMLYAYIIGMLYCCAGFALPKIVVQRSWKRMFSTAAILALLFCSVFFGASGIKAQHFGQMGSYNNGYLLNFALQLRNLSVKKPAEYSVETIKALEDKYVSQEIGDVREVDVIVIMSEAFGDLSVFGTPLSTNTEIMPFVSSLENNTIKGHALVSGIGGGTSNSEYEFLTSNSLGLLPTGCFPFQQYVKFGSYSVVSGFENMGYTSLGTHPASGENWMRTTVYPNFGFDGYYFVDDYPQENLLRGMVSDEEMINQLIQWFEQGSVTENQFIFGVTMQNHSPYDFENVVFSSPVELEELAQTHYDANQYLSLLNESDAAFEMLISYFEESDRDVVLLVFGDHMPQLSAAFYEDLHGSSFDTLEEQMLQYTVPFFIWANFDIEEQNIGLTSLNFLSNYLYEAAGLPLPSYNAFLRDVQEVIPAMNAFGYYSKEKDAFIPYDEADGKEAEMLNLYRILQYNCLFDENNRSQVFFPTSS